MRLIILLSVLFLFSCQSKPRVCKELKEGEAVLIAYRVAKHSHMWFLDPVTNTVYDIDGIGGRREPTIKLGQSIQVQYCDGDIIFDKYSYAVYPENADTRFIYMKGYQNLY